MELQCFMQHAVKGRFDPRLLLQPFSFTGISFATMSRSFRPVLKNDIPKAIKIISGTNSLLLVSIAFSVFILKLLN